MAVLVARTGRELQRYDNGGRRQVVGCIPYRLKRVESLDEEDDDDKAIEVLLITSQKGGDPVMFPKGGWEMDESIEQAACREAREEAGVVGTVEESLGRWSFRSKRYGKIYDGYMFPLRVTEEQDKWAEMNARGRRWVSIAEARQSCQHWWMKEAMEVLVNRLCIPNPCERKNIKLWC